MAGGMGITSIRLLIKRKAYCRDYMRASVNSYYAQQLLCSIVRQTERIVDIDSVSHFAATASELPIGVILRLNITFSDDMNQSHNVKPKQSQSFRVSTGESPQVKGGMNFSAEGAHST